MMMKRFWFIICFTLILLSSSFAMEMSLDLMGFWSKETNIFSSPLPQNGSNSFLQGVVDHPYLDRVDYGAKLDFSLFFHSGDRTGLSFSFAYGHAVEAIETIPVAENGGDFSSDDPVDWHYESYDALSTQRDKLAFGAGAVFRCNFSIMEMGSPVRAVITTFDFFDTFNLGIEAAPYIKVYFTDWLSIMTGLSFTAHIFHFIDSDTVFYETNYTQISLTPFIGIGFSFGGVM